MSFNYETQQFIARKLCYFSPDNALVLVYGVKGHSLYDIIYD